MHRVVLATFALVIVLAGGASLLTRSDDDGVTWLLPETLLDAPAEFASEAGPELWPAPLTVSLWRSGPDWVVVATNPLPPGNVLGTVGPLSTVFGESVLGSAGGFGGGGADDTEVWTYSTLDEPTLLAFGSALQDQPHPDTIEPAIELLVAPDGSYDPELRAALEAFELAARVTVTSDAGVRVVLGGAGEVGAIGLADPIPLDVIPVPAREVAAGDGYEIHEIGAATLIVVDGAVHTSITGLDASARRRAAESVSAVDDLRWGEWAWPAMGDRLRLAELDSDGRDAAGGCGAVIILDGGCLADVTPEGGLVWEGQAPSYARAPDGSWRVRLPVSDVGAPPGARLGVVGQNLVLFEFDAAAVPGVIEATVGTRREAQRLIKMLYPAKPVSR